VFSRELSASGDRSLSRHIIWDAQQGIGRLGNYAGEPGRTMARPSALAHHRAAATVISAGASAVSAWRNLRLEGLPS